MTRPAPTLAELDDYASGTLADADAERFEAELFAAAVQGENPAGPYLELRDGLVALCRRGTYGIVLTEAEAQQLQRSGVRIAYFDVDGERPARLSRSAEILLMRFALDLRGVTRLDVEMLAGGQPLKTMEDVSFEASEGVVYLACEAELAFEAARAGAGQRFVAVEGDRRRVLREVQPDSSRYVFED